MFLIHFHFCSSGTEIWHYDIKVLPNNECVFNNYSFTNLPAAINFYTENRLGSFFLREHVSDISINTQQTYYSAEHLALVS